MERHFETKSKNLIQREMVGWILVFDWSCIVHGLHRELSRFFINRSISEENRNALRVSCESIKVDVKSIIKNHYRYDL